MKTTQDRQAAEARFRTVFSHLGAVAAYARRRGNMDADALAAEVMTIAWRRLADVPLDDPRPWLFATARNPARWCPHQKSERDPALRLALRSLSRLEREALLLVAWDDLTPGQAARSLGINPAAFRVRLLRARRRLREKLDDASTGRRRDPKANLDMETT
jgi:RNA polymerase sigma-70 factor (ECF subfamily)